MSYIEYYYPLVSMTAKIGVSGIYFDCSSNKQINFANNQGIKGNAVSYYLQPTNASDQTILSPLYFSNDGLTGNAATNYLVIKHIDNSNINTPTNFNVAFPLITVKNNISMYTKTGRINEQLSKSIDNLNKVNPDQIIQFSLEHVIDSMTSFNPNSYYELLTPQSLIKTYVLKAPIYISTTIDTTKFDFGVKIPEIAITKETPATITRVIKKNNCKKNIPKNAEPKTLFAFLAKKEQSRIEYLNVIYSIGYLLFLIFFYNIYTRYPVIEKRSMVVLGIICVMLLIIVVPIKFMKKKGNRSALQHGIIFARYSVLGFAALLSIMFGKNVIETIKNIINNGLGGLDGIKYLLSRMLGNPVLLIVWIGVISLFIWSAILMFTQMKI